MATVASAASMNTITADAGQRLFHPVQGSSSKMSDLQAIFERILVPLYGPQVDALNKIQMATDRACFLLCEEELPVGVIVFKTVLSNEFAEYGIQNSIEIKSLFVVDSANNSGRGLGSTLFQKVVDEAKKLGLGHQAFHVTVSESKVESLNFFQRKGFRIVHTWTGKYLDNTKEYLLKYSLEPELSDGKTTAEKVEQLQVEKLQLDDKHWIKVIPNAHWGDIHALKLLSDGTFVSGSKDNSLCKWSKEGEMVKMVHEVEPALAEEAEWTTALGIVSDEFWVSGSRSGKVCLWSTKGDFIRNITPKLPKMGSHVSLPYNQRRVTCFGTGLASQHPNLFIGFPTMFDVYSWVAGKTVASTNAHSNDWVYCIHPLTDKKILTATGGTLQSWEKEGGTWRQGPDLLKEPPRRPRGTQRPFISSMANVGTNPNHLGLALFGGSVKVLDISKKSIVNHWTEHEKRVWTLESVSPTTFATSGEDKMIKLWDLRERRSVKTITHPKRQMHALLRLNEHTLIAGSDAPETVGTHDGASIFFYDWRKN